MSDAPPSLTDPEFRPGHRPVPEYTLVSKLGEGGFGQVWRARDDSGFEVALKFLRLDGRGGAVESRSLDVMKNVRHAHLLPMFREWRLGEWLVLAFELGDKTLYQRLVESEKAGQTGIPPSELLEYFRDAARALDFLHSQKIQHRDIKPHNILLVGGTVKVADYGLAKLVEDSQLSQSGAMTTNYVAPETLERRISEHSDQYSLAVSYCELRGGKLPFSGTVHQVLFGHLQGEPDLSMLPATEQPAVARALSKRPEDRWPSCRAFVDALLASYSGPMAPRPAPIASEPPPSLSNLLPLQTGPVWPIAIVVSALAMLAVGFLLFWPRG